MVLQTFRGWFSGSVVRFPRSNRAWYMFSYNYCTKCLYSNYNESSKHIYIHLLYKCLFSNNNESSKHIKPIDIIYVIIIYDYIYHMNQYQYNRSFQKPTIWTENIGVFQFKTSKDPRCHRRAFRRRQWFNGGVGGWFGFRQAEKITKTEITRVISCSIL